MRILLTGATGLIGSHLLHQLGKRSNCIVTCVGRRGSPQVAIDNVRYLRLDLTDIKQVSRLGGYTFDWVIHAAGVVSRATKTDAQKIRDYQINIAMALNTLSSLSGQPNVLLVSSRTVYPDYDYEYSNVDLSNFQNDPLPHWLGIGWTYRYIEKIFKIALDNSLISSLIVTRPAMLFGEYDDISTETNRYVPSLIRHALAGTFSIHLARSESDLVELVYAGSLAGEIADSILTGDASDIIVPHTKYQLSHGSLQKLLPAIIRLSSPDNSSNGDFFDVVDSCEDTKVWSSRVKRSFLENFSKTTGWLKSRDS